MSGREDRMRRILTVQERLKQTAEWRLAALRREESERMDAQRALVEALNSEEELHRLFVDAASRRIGRLSGEMEGIRRQQAVQGRRVVEESLKAKLTQRMAAAAAAAARKEAEKRLLDDAFQPSREDDASLP
jgi:hypothetical protein